MPCIATTGYDHRTNCIQKQNNAAQLPADSAGDQGYPTIPQVLSRLGNPAWEGPRHSQGMRAVMRRSGRQQPEVIWRISKHICEPLMQKNPYTHTWPAEPDQIEVPGCICHWPASSSDSSSDSYITALECDAVMPYRGPQLAPHAPMR